MQNIVFLKDKIIKELKDLLAIKKPNHLRTL